MKKVIVFDSEKVEEVKTLCESAILKLIETGHSMEVDEIMSSWVRKLCEEEIKNINEMIRMENTWAMGSNSVEQSQIHVENMMRLEKYKTLLSDMQEIYCV